MWLGVCRTLFFRVRVYEAGGRGVGVEGPGSLACMDTASLQRLRTGAATSSPMALLDLAISCCTAPCTAA